MNHRKPKQPYYFMGMGDGELINKGPYKSREDAAAEAPEIRQQYYEDHDYKYGSYTVCKIIDACENTINESVELPSHLFDYIEEWINDNVEGGTEDGVIDLHGSALDVLKTALITILTNHSSYIGGSAVVDCVETKFED